MELPKFVDEIRVTDPDTGYEVEVEIWKHPNGGLFGVDASFLDMGDGLCFDPFNGEGLELPEPE